jgi:ring-1,2-phenylacetyl-CoA epoxidase subunit PaaC
LFEPDGAEAALVAQGVTVAASSLRAAWDAAVREVLATATLTIPTDARVVSGGRRGRHTEHLGHMLAEMQILPRSYPGAKW